MNGNYPIRKGKCGQEQKQKSYAFHKVSSPFRRKGKCIEEQKRSYTFHELAPFYRKDKCGEKQKKDLTCFMSYRLPFVAFAHWCFSFAPNGVILPTLRNNRSVDLFLSSPITCWSCRSFFCSLPILIFSSLSSYHEKAAKALCVGQIQTSV